MGDMRKLRSKLLLVKPGMTMYFVGLKCHKCLQGDHKDVISEWVARGTQHRQRIHIIFSAMVILNIPGFLSHCVESRKRGGQ